MPRPTTVAEIREAYLAFFAAKGCVRYASSSLVPENDPTTLFTVAGMAQFKDMFLGRGSHPFTRATTVQKCIRTNDILNVGRTARHHTFFEMLGNFSFNDYFKKEMIHWAWEFLTKVLELPPERLSISVHQIDNEAYRIWREEIGIPANRIFKLGDNDNFWPANAPKEGIEGPGGCCSEIFWDHRINNDPNDNLTSSTGRFVEIWNLVFPEFNVRKPNADGSPNLEKLGRTNIDTGSGLERVAAVMQGVYNNFDIDVFQTIIKSVCVVSGRTYDPRVPLGTASLQAEHNALIRRIADHVRAVTFCIADGALPGNSDRGYIVRRLIRRATLDLDKLGCDQVRLFEIVPAVVASMGEAYPEIVRRQALASETLQAEEHLFRRTLKKGLEIFQKSLERQKGTGSFSADDAFELVTTHGFPKEVIEELAGAEGLQLDQERYRMRFEEHQRVSTSKGVEVWKVSALQDAKPKLGATAFVGYRALTTRTELTMLEVAGAAVATAATGSKVRFSLRETPFYGESGGQVGDCGAIEGDGFLIRVTDTQKDEGLVIHSGVVERGAAALGQVSAQVDGNRRGDITRHHSATHLLHSALTRFVGAHVEQQGSKVSSDELRFDFNNPKGLTPELITQIETWIAQQIAAKRSVTIRELPIEEAKRLGAKAQFGEKYGNTVRVVSMGGEADTVSVEFCGGCHVGNTADIGAFRITGETATAAGIRRVTAVAGRAAQGLIAAETKIAEAAGRHLGMVSVADPKQIHELARMFKCKVEDVPARVAQMATEVHQTTRLTKGSEVTMTGDLCDRVMVMQESLKRMRKRLEAQQAQAASGAADVIAAKQAMSGSIAYIVARHDGLDGKALRTLCEAVRSKRSAAIVVLGSVHEGKVGLVAAVPAELFSRGISAGTLISTLAPLVGGGGGGKPDFAQAGGKDPAGLDAALARVPALVAG
ncbi:MAG: alanine--tRNA ligase [Planctomycetota bacterium]